MNTVVVWVPLVEVAHPASSGTYEVLVDHWWVKDGNGNVALWQRGRLRWALANRDRAITERIGLPEAVKTAAEATLIKIPLGYMKHKCEDYV